VVVVVFQTAQAALVEREAEVQAVIPVWLPQLILAAAVVVVQTRRVELAAQVLL
jgi:hypothetical protein